MLLLGPNIHVAKGVTMIQNGIGGCHWAISDHLMSVCLLHWTWSPERAGIPDGFSPMQYELWLPGGLW